MRLTTKISMALSLLLLFGLTGAGLSVWNGRGLSSLYQQSDIAHRSYQSYLSLSSHTYQLFKQLGDSLLLRERVLGQRERELLFRINRELVYINQLVEEQRALDSSEVDDEHNIARDMAVLIETMVVEYQSVVRDINRSPKGSAWRRSARALDARLDGEFESLLTAALSKAKSRAERAAAEQSSLMAQFQKVAVYYAVVSIVATMLLILWMQREIRVPLHRLLEGAEALEAGQTSHRLALGDASVEFSVVAGAFNQMADKIDERQRGLGEINIQLELAVKDRTQALQTALKRVTELDETRRQLLADVSHELRTPLTIVRGEADLALRGKEKSPDSYRQSLRVSKDAADHMTRLVDDLLFVAKAESKQVQLRLERYDVVAQIQHLMPQLKHLGTGSATDNPVEFIHEKSQHWVDADADRIRQVILILLENALNYGCAPWVVELCRVDSQLRIEVRNGGEALSEVQMKMLFERFYRGSNSAKHYRNGAGLGLPVASAIVAAHGAELCAKSNAQDGTCMYFSLAETVAE